MQALYRSASILAALLAMTMAEAGPKLNERIDERTVRPGNVGPNSDNNSQVSPTSPNIPMTAQPPPEIAPGSGASGARTGESGSPRPYNPNPPTKLPQD